MATVTLLGTATLTSTSGTKTVTATPAVGDLIVLVVGHTNNVSTTAPTDNNSSGTYTLLETQFNGASNEHTLKLWVRDTLIAAATSTIFTTAPGTTTGGGLAVLAITGMTQVGAAAKRQSNGQTSIVGGTTPTVTLASAAVTDNPLIGVILNTANPAAVSPPAGWTERLDTGYGTPPTGVEVATLDSGVTSSTITWGSTSASGYASAVVELETSTGGRPDGRFTQLSVLGVMGFVQTFTAKAVEGGVSGLLRHLRQWYGG